MRKGQAFSIDFVISIVIVVLIVSTVLVAVEKRNFDERERFEKNQLEQKISSATFALVTSDYSCEAENSKIFYSIDKQKVLAEGSLKEKLGLQNYTTQIRLEGASGTQIINEEITTSNIYSIELNIMVCENSAGILFTDTLDCIEGICYPNKLKKEKLVITVGK